MARGHLRIYLGAAPGAGKTCTMLAEGQRRAARGTDVLAALVETHGRKLTAEMALSYDEPRMQHWPVSAVSPSDT